MLLVAALRLVLSDPHFLAEDVTDDARGHLRLGREVDLPVAAEHEQRRMEGLPFVGLDAVDEQPLALLDAVLLASDLDDCVGTHKRGKRGRRPASGEL